MRYSSALFLLFAIVLISSCTVEKRRYMDGYHVEWNHRHGKNQVADKTTISTPQAVEIAQSEPQQNDIHPEVVAETPVLTAESQTQQETNPAKGDHKSVSRKKQDVRHSDTTKGYSGGHFKFRNSNNASVSVTRAQNSATGNNAPDLIILVLLAIFIPPLAVFLHEGDINTNFWISLILWFCVILPGILFALWIVLR